MFEELKKMIDKIVRNKIAKNNKKIEELKEEKEKKFKIIEEDIKIQNEENAIFEKKCNKILLCIKKLNEMKNKSQESEEEEEEEEEEENQKPKF